jgi:hypothetical protein
MANRPILEIDVNDSEFTEFLKKFEDYKTKVAAMPQTWMSISYEINNLKTKFEKVLDDLEKHNHKTDETVESQGVFTASLAASELTFVGLSKSGRSFAHNIHQSTQSLMKWTKLTAVFSGLLGAGGLYGIDRMAAGAAAQRTSAMGLGVSYGEQASFLTNFGRLGNPEGILSGFSQGLSTPVGKAQIAHLLGHRPTGDAAETAAEALPKFKEFVDKTPDAQLGKMLDALGYSRLGLGVEQAKAVRGMSSKDVNDLSRSYSGGKTGLGLDDKTAKAWIVFTTQMEFAGRQLETVFAKNLVKLTPGLEHLSNSFVHLVDNLLKDGGPLKGGVDSLSSGIDKFAKAIEDKTFQQRVSEFVRDSGDAVKLIETMIASAPGGISALIGILIAARYGAGAAVAIGEGMGRSGLASAVATAGARVVPGLAAGAAIAGVTGVAGATPLNAGEDEAARQKKYGQGSRGAGASPPASRGGTTTPGTRTDIQSTARTPAGGTPSSELMATPGRHPDVADVDPRLREILAGGAAYLPPGYKATINEGYNPLGHRPNSEHHKKGKGALDVRITDPQGRVIRNEGGDPTGMYHRLAQGSYTDMLKNHPELKGQLAWGGAFGATGGDSAQDLMHFDIGGDRGRYEKNHLGVMGPLKGIGTHPANLGSTQPDVQIDNQAGSLVNVH